MRKFNYFQLFSFASSPLANHSLLSPCLWIRAETKQHGFHPGSTQIQANSTALLNKKFNLDRDYSILEKLQFKGE